MSRFLSSPAVVLVLGLSVLPLLLLGRVSLYEPGHGAGFYMPGTLTADNYAALRHAPVGFTIAFALMVALLGTGIGFGIALHLAGLTSPRRRVALGMLLAPKFAGALTTAFGLQLLLPRHVLTALLAEVTFILPYTVLVVLASLQEIPPTLGTAALGLGASRGQVFRRVTLPLAAPGLRVALQLSLIWGLGAFVGPLFLAGPAASTLATQLHQHVAELRWPVAAAEAMLLVVLATVVFLGVRARRSP